MWTLFLVFGEMLVKIAGCGFFVYCAGIVIMAEIEARLHCSSNER